MRFEKSIEIATSQQRVWDVISHIDGWPQLVETVDAIQQLTPPPIGAGSRFRLKQPKLPQGNWDVTAWEPPSYFEWVQKERGATIVGGHRVESLGKGRARLILTIEMRGLLIPIMGLFYRNLTNRYLDLEADGMKRAAESS